MRSVIRLLGLSLLGIFISLGVLVASPTDEIPASDSESIAVETGADPMSLDEALPGLAIPEVVEATDCCFFECEQGYFDCIRECKAAGGTTVSCSPVCSAERDDCLAGC